MRQVSCELLRHGPPNNQLLSPLTLYLALCENHAAVSVRVPFEHNQFLHRLRALSYGVSDEARTFQVADTARALGELLGQVPGLIAELNRDPHERPASYGDGAEDVPRRRERLTHLRLITSASELALLPLELSLTPNGFPGSGQPLLLQPQEPICLTREVRRVASRTFDWPRVPRVLFIAASPPSSTTPGAARRHIPFKEHEAILHRILNPWIGYAETDDDRKRLLNEHLVVLENASCEMIERECASQSFSHIHILAHGVEYRDGFDTRFGLALHHAADETQEDVVSGERLATALRAAQAPDGATLACPVLVTLASCFTGGQGTVAGPGSSVAHALHAAGIPMVVASQFPLSIPASLVFLDVLYSRLLWGEDPRAALNDLRRRLHSQFPATHDWASIVAYLSLAPDFEDRLCNIQIEQTMRSIEIAINHADRATALLMKPRKGRPVADSASSLGGDAKTKQLDDARARIERERGRLEFLLGRIENQRARICLLLGGTEKRCAEIHYTTRTAPRYATQSVGAGNINEWCRLLKNARKWYWRSFLFDRTSHRALTQYLSLDLLLRRSILLELSLQEPNTERDQPGELWTVANVLSLNDLQGNGETELVALGTQVELAILEMLLPGSSNASAQQCRNKAVARAREATSHADRNPAALYLMRRQIERYDSWFAEIANLDPLGDIVGDVLETLAGP